VFHYIIAMPEDVPHPDHVLPRDIRMASAPPAGARIISGRMR
jgi:hypothetical protein